MHGLVRKGNTQWKEKTVNNVQLKGTSLAGNGRGMYMNLLKVNLFISTGYCVLLDG